MDTTKTRLYLAYGSALEALRSLAVGQATPVNVAWPDERAGGIGRIDEPPPGLSLPVHVLVGPRDKRRPSSLVHRHVYAGSLPQEAFLQIERGLYTSSPGFCFIQMAAKLPFVDLVTLGYELCGSYSRSAQHPDGFLSHAPLVSNGRIAQLSETLSRPWAIAKSRTALSHIVDGSASPAETALCMMLTLPKRLGGYGLPNPKLNWTIEPNQAHRTLFDRAFYICDLCWPEQHVAIEYDSTLHHASRESLAHDACKRNALESMGYHVMTVTARQLYSAQELHRVALQVARYLGVRIQPTGYDHSQRRFELRRQLLWKS